MSLLEELCQLARRAGQAILAEKERATKVTFKHDESPLTSADLASHRTIVEGLTALDGSLPILSEESSTLPYETRKTWDRYFLVDPLDGTKEFIKGKKEYTVNIALIADGTPDLGVVYVPELQQIFAGARGLGAFRGRDGEPLQPITVAKDSQPVPKIVGSSSHASPEMGGFLRALGEHEILQFGSSLKICQVADGTAHFYPRFGPTSEWDTAAGHAVVLHAGGQVVTLDGRALGYNQKDSVLNPAFFVIGPADRPWLELARSVS